MEIAYINKNFGNKTIELIAEANVIIDEYMADDLQLTLRQLYYQFVSRGLLANTQSEYKRLGSIISDGRLAGVIDWYAIEDRTRNLVENSHWRDPGHIIRAAAAGFMVDHWENQPCRVEVWIEKEALSGVIASICEKLDVAYFACKGYVSQSEMWVSAQRLIKYAEDDQQPVIIHLGDHDPSGIDMTRDIIDRQNLFLGNVEIIRVALNMDQVEKYGPPPNPAKLSDTRSSGYIAKYGNESWELDALEPRTLRNLIHLTVKEYRDEEIYLAALAREDEYKKVLDRIEQGWQKL